MGTSATLSHRPGPVPGQVTVTPRVFLLVVSGAYGVFDVNIWFYRSKLAKSLYVSGYLRICYAAYAEH